MILVLFVNAGPSYTISVKTRKHTALLVSLDTSQKEVTQQQWLPLQNGSRKRRNNSYWQQRPKVALGFLGAEPRTEDNVLARVTIGSKQRTRHRLVGSRDWQSLLTAKLCLLLLAWTSLHYQLTWFQPEITSLKTSMRFYQNTYKPVGPFLGQSDVQYG